MKRQWIALLLALAFAVFLVPTIAEGNLDLDALMLDIEAEAEEDKALSVGPLTFQVSENHQSIYINKPTVTGSSSYKIAYNIYDADSYPVNYFYSMENRVAATPGYGGRFNVFVVVTDENTGASKTQDIGWHDLSWPLADALTVGKAAFEISPDRKSIFVDRPDIRCKSGSVNIAYNIYDSSSKPVNYFYSTQKRVAATPGYDGKFNVFIVVTDTITLEQNVQNIGWTILGEQQQESWPTTINGITYDLVGGKVTVTGKLPETGNLTFVDEVYGKKVTRIADNAFAQEMKTGKDGGVRLTGTLRMPGYLEYIGKNAFCNCDGLTGGLILPKTLQTIDEGAFMGCTGFGGALTIPDSVSAMGKSAFENCSGLTGLTLSARLSTIPEYGFRWCSSLTGMLKIPDSVKTISAGAFYECGGLTSLTFGQSLVTVGDSAFEKCSGLKGSLTFPDSVKTIDEYAFHWCEGLDGKLNLGSSLVTIGQRAFLNCSKLTGSLTFPNTVQTIGAEAFGNCRGFNGSLTLSASLTAVEDSAFRACTGLKGSLVIPDSVKVIGSGAFSECTGFDGDLTLGKLVKGIGEYAFWKCTGLKKVIFNCDGLLQIAKGAFEDCVLSGELNLPASLQTIEESAFAKCWGLSGPLTIPDRVKTIGNRAFYSCYGLDAALTIGDGVETIGNYAFFRCTNAKKLQLGANVKTIGYHAFEDCYRLIGTLTLPGKQLTRIDNEAFANCTGFTGKLVIPDSVTNISDRAFQYCTGMTGLSIGKKVRIIGISAFQYCFAMSGTVYIPSGCTVGKDAFDSTDLNVVYQ
ncbi:MAG: leucine-rich repeat domain-containing protein [Clostridia bacterium]|nr:leucine-rich repeat domain-containing protein [Clostridia bacterium]